MPTIGNSISKRVAVALESGSLAAPATIDFDAIASPGGLLATTQVEDQGLKRTYVDDAIINPRAGRRPRLRGLLSAAQAQIAPYMAGHTSGHAATGDAGVADLMDMMLRVAWGGQHISGGATLAATPGTAAEPELDAGEGANFGEYTWGYFYDVSASQGYFRLIESVSTDTLTMAAGHDLPFTPAAGDRVYAVSATYIDWNIIEDHSNAGNDLLQILLRGDLTDDVFHLIGVKPELQIGPIEAGSPTVLTMPLHCVQFEQGDGYADTPDLAQALQGSAGAIVGSGRTTRAYLAEVGSNLAAVETWGSVGITFGVTPERVMGPNGTEGVHGFGVTGESYMAGSVELSVPYDPAWRTAAEDGTEYAFMIQVGNAITSGPWAVYAPRLAFADDVEVSADADARRSQMLRFDALESDVSVTGLTSTETERARSRFVILRVA